MERLNFNTILKGFELDLFRIKNAHMYKHAIGTKELRIIAEKGKSLVHTEFCPSDADMTYIGVHLRKFIQKSNITSIDYIKGNIIDKLSIDYKEEKEGFYKIYKIFKEFLGDIPPQPMGFRIDGKMFYEIKTYKTVFDLLWYGDIIHRSGRKETLLLSLLYEDKLQLNIYIYNLYCALEYIVYILDSFLTSLKNLYKKIGEGSKIK